MSRKAEWEKDDDFMAIAAVVWADDFATSTSKPSQSCYGSEYSRRSTARARMKHRHDGFRCLEHVDGELEKRQRECESLEQAIVRLRGKMEP